MKRATNRRQALANAKKRGHIRRLIEQLGLASAAPANRAISEGVIIQFPTTERNRG
jgi:hypothetical protein